MKNLIVCLIALALSACFANPVKIDHIKTEIGSVHGEKCLHYVLRAIPIIQAHGYTTRLRYFDCGDTLHVMVTVGHTNLGFDSDHKDAITVTQMQRECPLATANGYAPYLLDYPPFGPPTGGPPVIGTY